MYPYEREYDIMVRTKFNLKFIETHQSKEGPYEVTQLINSFLGALAHPWEKYRQELKRYSMPELESRGWPHVGKEYKEDDNPKDLSDLLGLLRNGIAHGNIEFLPNEQNEIETICIWNINPRSEKRTWGTVLKIEDIRKFLKCFVDLVEQLHQDSKKKS